MDDVEERSVCSTLDNQTQKNVAEARVEVSRARLKEQRVVSEGGDGRRNRIVMHPIHELARSIMSDARLVRGQLTECDRAPLCRKFRNVPLNGRVEVELSAFGEPHRGRRRQQLRDAAEPIESVRGRGSLSLAIGLALGISNKNSASPTHGNRQGRDVRAVTQGVYVPFYRRARTLSDITRRPKRVPAYARFEQDPRQEQGSLAIRDSL